MLSMPQMLTDRRHRSSRYIRRRFGDDTRLVRPRIVADEHRIRPHPGQTMLPQCSEQQEENRQNRTSTAT
jgi:hypothetical protein